MPKTTHAVLATALLTGALAAPPAAAQYMPHLDPNLYMFAVMNMGGAQCVVDVPEKKLAEPRAAAVTALTAYFAAAGGRGTKSASFKTGSKAKLIVAGATIPATGIDAFVDPLAVAGHTLDPAPLRFYRAGYQGTALGQWAVRDASGATVGVYTAWLDPDVGFWKLRELTVSRADDVVEPVAPYCGKPGDTTEQRVTATANFVTTAEKQLAKRRTRLAEAQAGGDPALVTRERKKLTEAGEALAKARENHAEAVADADEIKRLTLPAREAEQMRQVAEPKPD